VHLHDRNSRIIAVLTNPISCSIVHRRLHNRSYHRNVYSHDDNVVRPQKVQIALKNDHKYLVPNSSFSQAVFERSTFALKIVVEEVNRALQQSKVEK
jgi:hypothetical protein